MREGKRKRRREKEGESKRVREREAEREGFQLKEIWCCDGDKWG